MACKMIDAQLVAYQLGQLRDEPRQSLEAHLATCAGCLAAFFVVKRAYDAASTNVELPSPRVRQSVLAAFEERGASSEVRPDTAQGRGGERPSAAPGRGRTTGGPVAVLTRRPVLAAFALAVAVATALWLWHPVKPHRGSSSGPNRSVDTASPAAQSLNTL